MTDTHLDNTMLFETTASGFHSGDFEVRTMDGFEAISTLYEFHLTLACTIDGGIDPDGVNALLDATCSIGFGPAGAQRVYGVLREIELTDMERDAVRSTYRAVLVPRFWMSTLTRRSRMFNDMTIPDIITEVLTAAKLADGTDFELLLTGSYEEREYVVQFEESDFAFLSRWMEKLGLYYFFDHSNDVDKLVITDANNQLVAVPDHPECTYAYIADTGVVGGIHQLRRRNRRMPANAYVRDYNWRTPAVAVQGSFAIDDTHGHGLYATYGEHFKDNGAGNARAQVIAETWNATKEVYSAWTVNTDMSSGHRISIVNAPVGELDQEYVITKVRHQAAQEGRSAGAGSYRNELEMIAYDVPYRAPRLTPWPRINGVMNATIDAESVNSAAPIDENGRYRVVIPYDLYGGYGGKATRWIRKAEPYSGPSYGMHFTLHMGSEVMLAHINGDPDRPVILGSPPNASQTSPLTQTDATRSAIRTRSGILFDFEDNAG